jgi:hypothetical protein
MFRSVAKEPIVTIRINKTARKTLIGLFVAHFAGIARGRASLAFLGGANFGPVAKRPVRTIRVG